MRPLRCACVCMCVNPHFGWKCICLCLDMSHQMMIQKRLFFQLLMYMASVSDFDVSERIYLCVRSRGVLVYVCTNPRQVLFLIPSKEYLAVSQNRDV